MRDFWTIKAKNGDVFLCHDPQPKAPATSEKPPKFYPADDVKKSLLNKRKPKSTKLRFMGKRIVFLKQLTSGLLSFAMSVRLVPVVFGFERQQWSSLSPLDGYCYWKKKVV
ncbi:hypothetical protein GQ457_17G002500 [Hibiscus cannabinus]